MKKKVLIIVSIFVILIGYISYIYFNRKKDNLNSLSSGIAMYVYNTTSNSFVANASIPVGNIYSLNTTLSHCVSGSNISGYNASAGTINYALNGADWCYIYFDVDTPPVISNLVASGDTVTATLTDNAALASYIVSTSASAPSSGYTEISGTSYNLSYSTKTSGTNTYYLYVKDSVGNITKSSSFSLTYTPPPAATTTLINLGVMATDAHTVSGTTYTNYRYTGRNPDNFACFDDGEGGCINYDKDNATNKPAGLFRIIGVFNSDTHGVTDTSGQSVPLVKLISADKLGNANIIWDYKKSGVGSSTTSYGSDDWSDSQLMYMLNGFVNTGYKGTTQLHTGYSYNSNTYYVSDGTRNIYKLNNGLSYLTGEGATASLYKPEITSESGWSSTSTISTQTLTTTQANMIATVTWKLGGTASYTSSSTGLASHWYNYERGTTTCYSAGKCSKTPRPTTWTGKIGLMYPSDYGYATSGGSTCANKELSNWNATGYETCSQNDWLKYTGSRTYAGTTTNQWTISPYTYDARNVFYFYAAGYLSNVNVSSDNYVCPSFYLESSVYVAGGSGTSTDPYRFAMD